MFSITERSKEATNCLPPILLASTRFSGSIRSPFLSSFSKLLRERASVQHFPKHDDESPRTEKRSSFPRLTTIILAQFPGLIRFTNNVRSLSRIRDPVPSPPSLPLFTEPTIEATQKRRTDYTRRGVDRFFQSWRPQDLDKARALSCTSLLPLLPARVPSLPRENAAGRESVVATRFFVTIRTGCGRPRRCSIGEKKSLP